MCVLCTFWHLRDYFLPDSESVELIQEKLFWWALWDTQQIGRWSCCSLPQVNIVFASAKTCLKNSWRTYSTLKPPSLVRFSHHYASSTQCKWKTKSYFYPYSQCNGIRVVRKCIIVNVKIQQDTGRPKFNPKWIIPTGCNKTWKFMLCPKEKFWKVISTLEV